MPRSDPNCLYRTDNTPDPRLVEEVLHYTLAGINFSRKCERRMISRDVVLGRNVVIHQPDLVNLYGCSIDEGSRIGAFVEVQKEATIGRNCKISSHSFICSGVTLEDGVFVGHGVMFINDLYPHAVNTDGSLQSEADWKIVPTRIRKSASLGSNCTIMGGVTVGEGALVGAGAVVTHDVPDYAIVAGVPARVVGDARERGKS